ncbi:MAG TPA: Ig-like domain-containing protein [Planctomycetota bacterium]
MAQAGSAQAVAAGLALMAASACSGGGGGSTAGTTSFQLLHTSVQDGAVWPLNLELTFTFTEPLDFATVSANTVQIRSSAHVPAIGEFQLRDPFTLVFQPACPTRVDLADAGLQPGETYLLRLPGQNTAANVLRSINGIPLGIQQQRTFSTPTSTQPGLAFRDLVPGPPLPVVRAQGSAETEATHVELGGDPGRRVHFERAPGGELVLSQPGFEMPLNLYSDASSSVAVQVVFDQPVNPSPTNISSSRIGLEFQDNGGVWRRIATRVTLVENCSESGATVRLEPVGVLPPASMFRARIEAGFQDIVGEASLVAQEDFAVAPTRPVEFTSLSPDLLSDEFQESFDLGGAGPRSFEDTEALFDSPVAEWGGGQLSAAFSFAGSGGPNGDFDWVVRTGDIFNFDTTATSIVGGPNGVPTSVQNTALGVVDVRNLVIEAGAEVRVQGPNPLRINATGEVRILGTLDLSGFNAKDVSTLDTGNQVESGGAGTAGAGRGGFANENTSGPTPRGGPGQGPFRQAGLGGQGGEMGVSNLPPTSNDGNTRDTRRPGGGGGGGFAWNWPEDEVVTVATGFTTQAGPGTSGHPLSVGAVSGLIPARGGSPGAGPFLDESDENDFLGVRPVVEAGQLTGLVRGELAQLWAGYGGGGGGNAGPFFPNPSWNFATDEKGGGGGGGGGGLHLRALGSIVFGPEGRILANGARGGTGENTYFLDHVGGTGGGGSGGHVILESATRVDFTAGGTAVNGPIADRIMACGPITNRGNQGWMAPCCANVSNGGAGGAGVVQIHVPQPVLPPSDPQAEIRVPTSALALANVLDGVSSPPAYVMIPTFGKQSKARSDWISIGGADQDPRPGSPERLVRFLFGGIETSGPDAGKILRNGAFVADLPPLVEELDLAASQGVRIGDDGFALELTGPALVQLRAGTIGDFSNDIYLRTPALLEGCSARLFVRNTPSNSEDFPIVAASYDEGSPAAGDERLTLQVTTEQGPLSDFNTNPTLDRTAFHLVPRFFQVVTGGQPDFLPQSAFVRIRFQAAGDNGAGAPDEANPLTDPPWTSDLSLFDQIPAGELQFFRFEVEFDLDALDQGIGASTQTVALDFLKIPFVF